MAIANAYAAYKRTYIDPAQALPGSRFSRLGTLYDQWWAYYSGAAFDIGNAAFWSAYKGKYQLYRSIRPLLNPVRRLVGFYSGHIYPGVLSDDGANLPAGTQLAIPFPADMDPTLRAAIAQLWQWSLWQQGKSLMVIYGAALGECLVEVVDAPSRGKVYWRVAHPAEVADLVLNDQGDVQAYALEYDYTDSSDGRTHTYRKEVDRERFATYRDRQPFDYSGGETGPEWPNPYGFVPAAWVRHTVLGGDHGEPCWISQQGKIDELCGLASHIRDQVHKLVDPPIGMAGVSAGTLRRIGEQSAASAAAKDTAEVDSGTAARRDGLQLYTMPAEGKVLPIVGDLNIADALEAEKALLEELERDFPELGMYQRLREMSQVTGPGADRMMGDVRARRDEAAANYDAQMIKLHQMGVAIAGFRASSGAWGVLTEQQRKFLPFGLQSYERGDLDHTILPRPLVPVTEEEQLNNAVLKQSLGVSQTVLLAELGYDEIQIAAMKAEKQADARAMGDRLLAQFNRGTDLEGGEED